MSTDPIADLLTCIRNGIKAKHKAVRVPASTFKQEILKVMQQNRYIKNFSVSKNASGFEEILVELDLENCHNINLKRISKPGNRIYQDKKSLPRVCNDMGIAIVTTSKGLMTNREAKKQGLGGEIICEIW